MEDSNNFMTPEDSRTDVVAESFAALELGSLLEEVAAHALSAPGRDQVLEAVPGTEAAHIVAELALVAELKELVALDGPLGLGSLVPMEGLLSRLVNPAVVLDAEEILVVADLLAVGDVVQDRLQRLGQRFKLLINLAEKVISLGGLRNRIGQVFDEHGTVRASASPQLMRIRERSGGVRRRIGRMLEGIVRDRDLARIVQEDYVTLRNDRYVILLRPEFKGLLDGIVHDHSRSGASVYVEPLEVVALNNEVASLMDEDRDEVRRIFAELTEKIRSWSQELTSNYELLSWLDAFQARALYAIATNSVVPELVEEGFGILGARHPLLIAAGEGEVVPMDVIMEPNKTATIISGANMGGKTVALKIAGLFPLMTRCAIMLPAAEGTRIRPFVRIMADIGDEQDIRGHVSSFSGHMLRIKAIMDTAGREDLVVLDELGGATDPEEGSALAMGILDELLRRGATVVVTTHLTHLKAYALGHSEVQNVSVEFHPETLKPTFRLLYDLPGESHAIVTAERIGLPGSVIEAARRYADKHAGGSTELIRTLRNRISELDARRAQLERTGRDLEEELAKVRSSREEIVESFREEALQLIRKAERELIDLQRAIKAGRMKEGKKPREELRRIREEMAAGLGTPLEKEKPLPDVGARVRLAALGKEGIVQSVLEGGHLEVAVGNVKIRAHVGDVTVIDEHAGKKSSLKKKQIRVDIPPAAPSWEVNVIGLRVHEALPVVDRAVDKAVLGGLSTLNIIHGKGTGRLKQAIRDHLSGHALVRGFRSAGLQVGGEGVTVVDLKGD